MLPSSEAGASAPARGCCCPQMFISMGVSSRCSASCALIGHTVTGAVSPAVGSFLPPSQSGPSFRHGTEPTHGGQPAAGFVG